MKFVTIENIYFQSLQLRNFEQQVESLYVKKDNIQQHLLPPKYLPDHSARQKTSLM